MKRYLDTLVVFLQCLILLAVALFWWSRLNGDWNGSIVRWINDRYYQLRSFFERLAGRDEAQQFRDWVNRHWGEQIDLDSD